MTFGTPQNLNKFKQLKITYCDQEIEQVESYKYLGIMLDDKLNFSKHAAYIRSKVIPRLRMLGKLKQTISKNLKLLLYKTLIMPLFDYGDIIYDGLNQRDSIMLQRLQNSALRIILDVNREHSTELMHSELNLLKLEQRRKHHTCHQTYRIHIEETPPHLGKIIKPVVHRSERYLRSSDKSLLEVPNFRLNVARRSYNYRGPVLWNKLKECIKESQSLAVFKSSLYTSSHI